MMLEFCAIPIINFKVLSLGVSIKISVQSIIATSLLKFLKRFKDFFLPTNS